LNQNYAQFAFVRLIGAKNGNETGQMLNTAQNAAKVMQKI
jgi:hypothetical protein